MTAKPRFALFALALMLLGAVHRPQAGGVAWQQSEIAGLDRRITSALESPVLRGAHVGLEIVDTERGTPIYSRGAGDEFMPASNFKLLVGSTALARLGVQFTFDTAVLADAAPNGGTIDGNVYLRGGGDAQLTATDLDSAAMSLAAQGVRRIAGALLIDTSRYDDARFAPGWLRDDIPYYYSPALSALEVEEGVVHVRVTAAAQPGAPALLRISPESNTYTIDNRIATGERGTKDTTDIVRPWDAPHTIRLVGSYPIGAPESDDMAPSVPDPAALAGDILARALAAHGIAVEKGVAAGSAPAAASILWTHRSAALPKLLADMWIPSDNLMAEMFLKELGVQQSGAPGTDANGALAEQAYLRSIVVDPATVSILDGSGLSAYDRITPRDIVSILQSDWRGPYRDVVLDALPIAGVRGTLKDAYTGTPAQGAVFAKTGTWTHVTTLSGYVQTASHGPVTFSFLINDWLGDDTPGGTAELAHVREAIFSAIARQ